MMLNIDREEDGDDDDGDGIDTSTVKTPRNNQRAQANVTLQRVDANGDAIVDGGVPEDGNNEAMEDDENGKVMPN